MTPKHKALGKKSEQNSEMTKKNKNNPAQYNKTAGKFYSNFSQIGNYKIK